MSRGKSPREIAEVLMLDEDTVGNYRKRYEVGGIAGLLKDVYLGSAPMLSSAEMEELANHLETQTYLTVDSIVEYVFSPFTLSTGFPLDRFDFVSSSERAGTTLSR